MTDAQAGTYLDRIVADVRVRLDADASSPPRGRPPEAKDPRSLCASIRARRELGELAIIAEVKRRSPSVGDIDVAVDVAARAGEYVAAGAAGISVLTEVDHFGGSLDDLVAARRTAGAVPVLRKDFVLEASQLLAARAASADAVLLIAALHGRGRLASLVGGAQTLGLEVLLEVHDEAELDAALSTTAEMIGINSRDLRSFEVDLGVVERLAPLIPSDRLIVAESGVRTTADAVRMREAGVDALLVGEALMRADDVAALLRAMATATTESPAGAAT